VDQSFYELGDSDEFRKLLNVFLYESGPCLLTPTVSSLLAFLSLDLSYAFANAHNLTCQLMRPSSTLFAYSHDT
jgi:hypothetical protein